MYEDDTTVTSGTVTDEMIRSANADLADTIRNNAEPTEPELDQMAADAQITVRPRPLFLDLTRPRTDALGQVPPESAADLLEMVDDETGCSHLWHVDTEGRVFVARVINAGEAHKLGSLVARHLEKNCGIVSPVSVEVVEAGEPNLWHTYVTENGERHKVDYAIPGPRWVAEQCAEELRVGKCSTMAVAVVAVGESAEGKAA